MSTHQQEIERLKSLMLKKSYYVMFRKVIDRSKLAAVLLDHYHWIIALEKKGLVFASGPLFEADGSQGVGMTVFRASSEEEASALAAGDPFCALGAMTFTIQRWQLNEGRIQIHLDISDQTYSLG
ncbi:MAG: hypothetical protein HYX42_00800 [Polaromonas sp.]|uniref:YciI family protein n=1 Tax=Polaromonas sp. TaxID=1869339 RepID=UPI0025E07F71|nr:YciI family protein [Polaromonas sp.]MBI2724764.1 hypothetical protein [Polaromonas sp.]